MAIVQETEVPIRHHYFYSAGTVPQAVLGCSELVVEVGAGGNPFGLKLAQEHPQTTVVSVDVQQPSKKGIRKWGRRIGVPGIQDNFYYLVDVLDKLPIPRMSAFFSLFPSNKPDTMEWLPDTVAQAVKVKPDAYMAIVTENSTGKSHTGEPSYGLGERLIEYFKNSGLPFVSTPLGFEEVGRSFTSTEYTQFLQCYAGSVTLLELNPERRGEFLGI